MPMMMAMMTAIIMPANNAPRFYEPLPSGPYKGRTVKREIFEKEKKEYYEALGWDENGLPKPEVLRKLGLRKVETKLRKTNILNY